MKIELSNDELKIIQFFIEDDLKMRMRISNNYYTFLIQFLKKITDAQNK